MVKTMIFGLAAALAVGLFGSAFGDETQGEVVATAEAAFSIKADDGAFAFDTRAVRLMTQNEAVAVAHSSNAWNEAASSAEKATVAMFRNGKQVSSAQYGDDDAYTWTATGDGMFTFTHAPGVPEEDPLDSYLFVLNDPYRYEQLTNAFPQAAVEAQTNEYGYVTNYVVTLTNDVTGPVFLPDDVGPIALNMNGWNVTGQDGEDGTSSTAGGNGGPAVVITPGVHPDYDESVFFLFDDKDQPIGPHGEREPGRIVGGDGGDGVPVGAGGDAIVKEPGVREGAGWTEDSEPFLAKGNDGHLIPTILLHRVQQRYPWNGFVDIDYSVTNMEADCQANYFVRFTVVTNLETEAGVVCKEFLSSPALAEGAYRVTWDSVKDGEHFFELDIAMKAEIVSVPADTGVVVSKAESPVDGFDLRCDKVRKITDPSELLDFAWNNGEQWPSGGVDTVTTTVTVTKMNGEDRTDPKDWTPAGDPETLVDGLVGEDTVEWTDYRARLYKAELTRSDGSSLTAYFDLLELNAAIVAGTIILSIDPGESENEWSIVFGAILKEDATTTFEDWFPGALASRQIKVAVADTPEGLDAAKLVTITKGEVKPFKDKPNTAEIRTDELEVGKRSYFRLVIEE